MSAEDLSTYQLQLQQVEAALTADPENAELLKLKEDLDQVIQLTVDLIESQTRKSGADALKKAAKKEASEQQQPDSTKSFAEDLTPVKHWQVGEQCQALSTRDGLYYEARINEITTDGQVSVTFKTNGQEGVTSLGLLRLSKHGYTRTSTSAQSKKQEREKHKEYLKKKKAKKQERLRQMEKVREDDKNKWQNFSTKAFGKKGFVKKSIFKTPENASGRVGIGTCGVAGNSMTKFNTATKYNKRSN